MADISVSGYNDSPPSDDGSKTESNRIKWSTIKSKLTDPLKTAIDSLIGYDVFAGYVRDTQNESILVGSIPTATTIQLTVTPRFSDSFLVFSLAFTAAIEDGQTYEFTVASPTGTVTANARAIHAEGATSSSVDHIVVIQGKITGKDGSGNFELTPYVNSGTAGVNISDMDLVYTEVQN